MEQKKLGFGLMRLPLKDADNQESIDMEALNKMVDTAGQMVNAVSQVSSVVKGFGGMFKA